MRMRERPEFGCVSVTTVFYLNRVKIDRQGANSMHNENAREARVWMCVRDYRLLLKSSENRSTRRELE